MERKREVAEGGDGRKETRRRESECGGDTTHMPPIGHPAPHLHHSTVKSQPDGLIVVEMKSRTRKIVRGGNWCVAGRNKHTAGNHRAWSLSIRDQSQMYVGLKSMSKGGRGEREIKTMFLTHCVSPSNLPGTALYVPLVARDACA